MSLYIDLTEFLASLRKTGIERISGELCRHLPNKAIIPIRFRQGRYLALPPLLIEQIGQYFHNGEAMGIAAGIRRAADETSELRFRERDLVLVPEIFGEERAAFFRSLSDHELQRYRFLIYDLLPLTHPEYFLPDMALDMFGYFHTIRRATCCGFISENTRQFYYSRLKRTISGGGVVLPLGCDALGPRATEPTFNRPLTFTVLGTIEPRKNHALILEAFEPLLREINGLNLLFVGKIGCVDQKFAMKVQSLASDQNSGLRFYAAPDDRTILNLVRESRATIYISPAEGYGLPPVESLWVGTPVIASTAIPSLTRLGTSGIHYVEPLSIENLRQAVLAFTDNLYANQKIEESTHLTLPTWSVFAQEVLHWCKQ